MPRKERFFPPAGRRSGMAKSAFGEYITFAVVLRRFSISCPMRVASVRKGKRMTMRWLLRIALFSFVLALMLPPLATAQSGADTFKAKCAMCHGADGAGKPAMGTKDLGSADIQKMSDADLTGAITNGKGKMPAYKGKLTDAQMGDLVKYVRTLKK